MDRYPLILSVPRADTARSALGFPHTAYLIEVDDCGKVYTRHRRYNNFLWLHRELRRRELPCTLPELPPKKALGSLEQTFVERRRQMLEDYLRALLRLPPVVLDDTLWAFLDADLATAMVPRFLCRPPSHTDTFECLTQLANIVAREANIFRFCSLAVLGELVAFTHTEAAEAAVQAPPQAQQALQARLGSRVRICSIVQSLVSHERARQGLVEAGMFGALLALLWRVTEDCEAVVPMGGLASAADAHWAACFSVKNCLKQLLEDSRGTALLDFCQQDDGLGALQRLAVAENVSLHPVAASLLWHGFQNSSVVTAIAGAKTGLPLLGKLLKSPDLPARVLASLCVCCLVRQEGALEPEAREHCLQALVPLARELEAAEAAAMERAAASQDRGPGPPEADCRGTTAPEASAAGADSGTGAVAAERDPSLVGLLRSLCSPREVPRLQALLGDPAGPGIDAVTATVVLLLDHFVQQSEDEPATLKDLSHLAPQLQRLLDCHADVPWGVEPCEGYTFPEPDARHVDVDVRTRAARVLIRLDWPGGGKAGSREAPALAVFGQRVRILDSLRRQAEACQEQTAVRLTAAGEHCCQQGDHVQAGGLILAPCLDSVRLDEFGAHLAGLAERRQALKRELQKARQAVDSLGVNLDQRGVKRNIITAEVEDLCQVVSKQSTQSCRTEEAQTSVNRCEERSRELTAQVDAQLAQLRTAEALAREAAARARDADDRAATLSHDEAEKAEVCHSAPARLERLHAGLTDVERQRASTAHSAAQLSSAADREGRRRTALGEAEQEAKAALQNLSAVHAKLQVFQRTLTSELILTDDEVDKLRQLEMELQPARPSRLRYSLDVDISVANGDLEDSGGTGEEHDAPVWDDAQAAQEFRETPHFRSFSRLRDERETLWGAELQWLRDALSRAEATLGRLAQQRKELEQEDQSLQEEEEKLHKYVAFWDDLEGHAARHREARTAAAASREVACEEAAKAAEAAGNQKLAEARLEQDQARALEADAVLAAARDAADVEAERSLRDRLELEKRCLELEARARTYMGGWRAVDLEERRVALLQARVAMRLQDEADGRGVLRAEAQRLIAELQELDRQLDVAAEHPA